MASVELEVVMWSGSGAPSGDKGQSPWRRAPDKGAGGRSLLKLKAF